MMKRRTVLKILWLSSLWWLSMWARHERNALWLFHTQEHIRTTNTIEALRICLLQISDLHIHQNNLLTATGDAVSDIAELAVRSTELYTAQWYKVMAVLTGDLVTCAKWWWLRAETKQSYFEQRFPLLARELQNNWIPLFSVMGNHDRKISRTLALQSFLESEWVCYLAPGMIEQPFLEKNFSLVWLPDYQTESHLRNADTVAAITAVLEHDNPTLCFWHNADVLQVRDTLDTVKNTLFLSGHVHGLPTWYLRSVMGYSSPFVSWPYPVWLGSTVYVSDGVGTTQDMPFRPTKPKIDIHLLS